MTVPRIHCEGKGIQAEATIQGPVIAELRAMGHKVVHSPHSFDAPRLQNGLWAFAHRGHASLLRRRSYRHSTNW